MKHIPRSPNHRRSLTTAALTILILTLILFPQPQAEASSTVNLKPVADAYVNSAQPTINYGAARALNAQRSPSIVSYLKFNLTEIPANAEIVEARLILNLTEKTLESTSKLGLHLVEDYLWDELAISWSNAPLYEPNPIVLNDRVAYTPSEQTWNVTDVVADALDNGMLSLALVSYADTGRDTFGSKDSGQPPILEVSYDLPWVVGFTRLDIDPPNPTSEDRVRVYAGLNSTADHVFLYFNTSTVWERMEMIPIGNGTYVGVVPKQPSGVSVGYYVVASSRLSGDVKSNIGAYRVDRPLYYKDLVREYQDLQSKYDDLQERYRDLGFRYEDLLRNYTTLQQRYDELQTGYDGLGKLYNTLRTQYFNLEGSYNSLRSQLDDVNKSYEDLKGGPNTVDVRSESGTDGSGQLLNNAILASTGSAAAVTLFLAIQMWRRKPS